MQLLLSGTRKAARTVAWATGLCLAGSVAAQAAVTLPGDLNPYTAFDFQGLSFNKGQQGGNDPGPTSYTYLSLGKDVTKSDAQAQQLLVDTNFVLNMGDLKYTMYVPDAQVPGTFPRAWTGLSGSYLSFASGNAMALKNQNGTSAGSLTITGGTMRVDGALDTIKQDLPFGLGQDISSDFYALAGDIEFRVLLNNGADIVGTWAFDHAKPICGNDANGCPKVDYLIDPLNGNPANTTPNDLVFMFQSVSTNFTCGQALPTAGGAGACDMYKYGEPVIEKVTIDASSTDQVDLTTPTCSGSGYVYSNSLNMCFKASNGDTKAANCPAGAALDGALDKCVKTTKVYSCPDQTWTLKNAGDSHTCSRDEEKFQVSDKNELAANFIGWGGTSPLVDPNAVPEPTTLAVLGLGMLGLVATRRRRH